MRHSTARTAIAGASKFLVRFFVRPIVPTLEQCLAALLLLSVASCTSNQRSIQTIDPIGDQWRKTMSLYHVLPVYPPNEDVHVGDLYLFPGCPAGPDVKNADDCEVKLGLDMDGFKIDYDPIVLSDLKNYYSEQFIITSIPSDQTQPASASSSAKGQQNSNSCDLNSVVYCLLQEAVQQRQAKEKKASDAAATAKTEANQAYKAIASAKNPADKAAAQQKANDASSKATTAQQQADTAKKQVNDAEDAAKSKVNIFTQVGTPTNLPIAGFPGFTTYTSYDASASASVPIHFLSAGLAGHASKNVAVSVQFDGVITYGIPVLDAVVRLRKYCAGAEASSGDKDLDAVRCQSSFLQNIVAMRTRNGKTYTPSLCIVNRVYLASKITFTFAKNDAEGLSATLKAELDGAIKQNSQLAANALSAPSPSSTQQQNTVQTAINAQQLLAQGSQAAQTVGALPTATQPGVTLSYGDASGNSISLTETFPRPVVIGYEAVSLTNDYSTE